MLDFLDADILGDFVGVLGFLWYIVFLACWFFGFCLLGAVSFEVLGFEVLFFWV